MRTFICLIAGAALLAGCSVNPLNPDRKGCIIIAGQDSCQTGTGGGDEGGACGAACRNLSDCGELGRLQVNSVDACVSGCDAGGLDQSLVDCVANAESCGVVSGCFGGGGGGDDIEGCEPFCINLQQCGLLEASLEQCRGVCASGDISQDIVTCAAQAQNCDGVTACVQ